MSGEGANRTRGGIRYELALVMLLALAVFQAASFMISWGMDHYFLWDIPSHVGIAAMSNELGIMPGHFLFFYSLSAGCGFCSDADRIMEITPYVVGVFTAAKFVLSWLVLRHVFVPDRGDAVWLPRFPRIVIPITALLIGFTFCLPYPNIYRGQFPANQWHNTTTIALIPIVIAVFWLAVNYMRNPRYLTAGALTVAVLASLATKPSYAMAFIPAFPILLLFWKMDRKWKLVGCGVVGILLFALGVQYWWISSSEQYSQLRDAWLSAKGFTGDTDSGVVIDPFKVWLQRSSLIPASLLSSILFPLLVVWARGKAVLRDPAVALAWLTFLCALASYIVFAETGRNKDYGNFAWGGIVTMYILFLASAGALLQKRLRKSIRLDTVAWIGFALHVAAGVAALTRMFTDHGLKGLV